jgi:outer membrane protein OmpA-like peptidoglycan-associated protein
MRNLSLFILSALSFLAQAQPIKSATSDELIEKLAVPFANTRSLTARNLEPQPRSLDLVIQFEFDSAKLKPESKPLLNNLSMALKSERLKSIQFKVEGHTDAKGTEAYNQTLSLKRANAVVEYMTQQGIETERLKAEGKGFAELLIPEKPLAMENRRVRISTIQ